MPEPLSASLLRRLADVAEAHPTGQPLYFVLRLAPPHDFMGAFASEHEADDTVAQAGAEFAKFGPYTTEAERHASWRSPLVSINLTIRRPPGGLASALVDPAEYDMAVWSISAFDRFVAPYYAHRIGIEATLKLRQDFLNPRAVIFLHKFFSIGRIWDEASFR